MIASKRVSIAQTLVCLSLAAASVGCAAADAEGRTAEFAEADLGPVRVGQTRVIDAGVNPMVPVHLAAEASAVTATFGLPGRRQVVARFDPGSLELLSRQQTGRSEPPSAPATGAARAEFESGRFLVCWTRVGADGGHEAVAQMWTGSGSRLGRPMVISPPGVDVYGAPRAASIDGRHVLVTFPESSGESFELRVVSLEEAGQPGDSDGMAQR